jgi:hypothetical protein
MTETSPREVFRAEAREGQHIRLIVAGEIDEAVLDSLEDFIAWRRRLAPPDSVLDIMDTPGTPKTPCADLCAD